jgi:excisionase family DNA binding protein
MTRLASMSPESNGHTESLPTLAAQVADSPSPSERSPEPLLWNLARTAKALGVSAKTVQRMAAAGELPGSVKLGRRRLFARKSIENWIAQGCPSVRRGRK